MTNHWKDIHLDFNYHGWDWETNYQRQWESKGFTYWTTKDWIDIGFKPQEANYCAWLRDSKQVDAEWVLNYGDNEQLQREYQANLTNKPLALNSQPNWPLIIALVLIALLIF